MTQMFKLADNYNKRHVTTVFHMFSKLCRNVEDIQKRRQKSFRDDNHNIRVQNLTADCVKGIRGLHSRLDPG